MYARFTVSFRFGAHSSCDLSISGLRSVQHQPHESTANSRSRKHRPTCVYMCSSCKLNLIWSQCQGTSPTKCKEKEAEASGTSNTTSLTSTSTLKLYLRFSFGPEKAVLTHIPEGPPKMLHHPHPDSSADLYIHTSEPAGPLRALLDTLHAHLRAILLLKSRCIHRAIPLSTGRRL